MFVEEGGHLSNDLKKFGRVGNAGEKLGAVADRHFSQKMTNNQMLRSVFTKGWVVPQAYI